MSMKKSFWKIIIAVVMTLSLSACKSNTDNVPSVENSSEEKSSEPIPEVSVDQIVGQWHLDESATDLEALNEAFPGAMEFGNGMEIKSDGKISWYIGTDGGTGTYELSGDRISATFTGDLDGVSYDSVIKIEKTRDYYNLVMSYNDFTFTWNYGEGGTGKGNDEVEEWKTTFEASLLENYGVVPDHYEDLGDGIYQVYVEIDGKAVPYVTVDSNTGEYHG